MEWYDGLDREQVKAVIEFAARSLDRPQEFAQLNAIMETRTSPGS